MSNEYLRQSDLGKLVMLTPDEDAERIYAEKLADMGGESPLSLQEEYRRAPNQAARDALMAEMKTRGGSYEQMPPTSTASPMDDFDQKYFGKSMKKPASGGFDAAKFDAEYFSAGSEAPTAQKKSSFARRAADVPIGLAKGFVDLPSAAVGLGDIVTGGGASKVSDAILDGAAVAADAIGLPAWARPSQWSKKLEEAYSPEMTASKQAAMASAKQAEEEAKAAGDGRAMQLASEFGGYIKGAIQNPAAALALATENYGGMKAIAMGTARVLKPIAAALDAEVAAGTLTAAEANAQLSNAAGRYAAIGEGILTSGQGASQVKAENPDATWADYLLQVPAGVITGTIARGASKLPGGWGDAEQVMALNQLGRGIASGDGTFLRALKGGISEGVIQEMPQSVQEQIWQNLGTNKPWDDQLGISAAQGLIAGFPMGAGAAAISRARTVDEAIDAANAAVDSGAQTIDLAKQTSDDLNALQQGVADLRQADSGVPAMAERLREQGVDMAPQQRLLGYQAGEPLIVFPDGSAMTRAEYEQHGLAEDKARLDAMVQDAPLPGMMQRAQELAQPIADKAEFDSLREQELSDKQQRIAAERAKLASRKAQAVEQTLAGDAAQPAPTQVERPVVQQAAKAQSEAIAADPEMMAQYNAAKAAGDTAEMNRLAHEINAQKRKAQKEATTPAEPKKAMPLSVGMSPGDAAPITVQNGVVHIGEYPAQNFETGDDVTVPHGAGHQQIVEALRSSGAIGKGQRVFGMSDTQPEAGKPNAEKKPRTRITAIGDERVVKYVGDLRAMAGDVGWAEEGGKLLRDVNGNPSGRTRWIPHAEWFVAGMIGTPKAAMAAVEKAIAGEPMSAKEKRTVQAMMDWLDNVNSQQAEMEALENMGYDETPKAEQDVINTLGDFDIDNPSSTLAVSDTAQSMRALGFTEDEINAELEQKNTRQGDEANASSTQVEAEANVSERPETSASESGRPEASQGESLDLRGQTNAEAAEEFKRKQEEENRQEKDAPAKNVTSDQVDLFNTQGGLLSSNRDSAKSEAATPAVETKPSEKIEDFGEKIGGARKDVWTSFKDNLSEVSDDEVINQPFSKSWPEPDYQKMIDDGADAWSVGFMRAARDEVPRKPTANWKKKNWAEQVKLLRKTALGLLDGTLPKERAQELLKEQAAKSPGMRKLQSRIELYQLVGHSKSLAGISFDEHYYSLYKGKENVHLWAVSQDAKASAFSNWPKELATGATKEEALQKFKEQYAALETGPAKKPAVSFDIYSRKDGGFWIGKKLGRNPIFVAGPFKTVAEARSYRDANNAELVAKLEKNKEIPKERRDTNNPRVGEDMRNGQDVTPMMFGEAFGFKGVEFGNWVEQKRRQKDLNDAFDALMDMAAVLGVPPKAISLNGELGLAFGARGSGGVGAAAAHYEPGKIVINLTKKEGAGSLGHEWWHALDNYFQRLRGKGEYATEALDVSLAARGSQFVVNTAMRGEMVEAFGAVVRAIKETALKARSSKLDAKRSKEYWTTGREMAARAFESYLISKLQDQNASNDYLANIVDDETWAAAEKLGFELEGSYPYPTAGEMPGIRAGFDRFFKSIETKQTDKGIAFYSQSRATEKQDGVKSEDIAVDDLPDNVRPVAKALGVISRLLGKTIVYRTNLGGDGMVMDSKTIYLDPNQLEGTGAVQVFGHEFWHQVKMSHPEIWQAVVDHLEQQGALTDDVLVSQYQDYFATASAEFSEKTTEQITDALDEPFVDPEGSKHESLRSFLTQELMSDLSGNRFAESEFWSDVFAKLEEKEGSLKATTLIRRFVKSLTAMLDKVLGLMKMQGFKADEMLGAHLDEVRSALAEGMAQYLYDTEYGNKEATGNAKESRNSPTRLANDEEEITLEGIESKEDEDAIDRAERIFLSSFPKSVRTYSRKSPTARAAKAASEQAWSELGSDAARTRGVASVLGPFSGYATKEVRTKGLDGKQMLLVQVYGNEQVDAGLDYAPALSMTIDENGEFSIYGPPSGSKLYRDFSRRGWSEPTRDANGNIHETLDGGFWTKLTDATRQQSIGLLGDAHARAKDWLGVNHLGIHWKRTTGATGNTTGREGALYFSTRRAQESGEGKPFTLEVTTKEGQRFRDGVTATDEADAISFARFLWPDSDVRVLAQKAFVPDIRYSLPRQSQWYYSNLAKQIESAPEKVFGPAKQVKAWLQSNSGKLGIKQDEMQWTGVLDWLDLQQRVTKADVLGYLQQNGVQVQEVMKGSVPEGYLDVLLFDNGVFTEKELEKLDYDEKVAAAQNNDLLDAADKTETKYAQYVLPGGENYRELLLTLPKKKATIKPEGEKFAVMLPDGRRFGLYSSRSDAESALNRTDGQIGPDFQSSHWSDTKNILAHIRFNDRTDADGNKVLFIEEIQSDWQQAKRGGKDAPNGPFVGTSDPKPVVALAVKRMIAYAVQNRYDKVAFVNGEQSAERYDLSKQVDSVHVDHGQDGYRVWARKGGDTVIEKDYLSESALRDTIGKELADKAIAHIEARRTTAKYEGDNLKVGGEGMKTFYDTIVPQVVNDVLKKVGGGKVEAVKMTVPGSKVDIDGMRSGAYRSEQPGFTITPAMQEKVAGGQALFSTARSDRTNIDTALRRMDKFVSEFEAGRMKDAYTQILGRTPVVLRMLGANDLPLQIDGATVRKALAGKHQFDLSAEMLRQVPEGLYDPLMVFDSATGDGKVMVTEIASKNGKPVVAAVHFDKKHGSLRINDVASVHEKTEAEKSLISWIDGGLLRYVRNEKDLSGPATRHLLPASVADRLKGRMGNVAQESDLVNQYGNQFSRARIIGDSGRQYTNAQKQMFKGVGREVNDLTVGEKWKELRKDLGKKLAQGIVDQFAPIKDITEKGYMLARLSKGATGAFEAFMHHGKLSLNAGAYDADTSGGVMEKVFYPLGKETTDFLYWIAGNRAERLAREGKENLFSKQDILAAKSLSSGTTDFDYTLRDGQVTRDRTKIYADALQNFNEFSRNVMDMAEQSGLIDKESRHLWEHDFYVPFYRVMEDDVIGGANIGKGLARQTAFKKLKGGTESLNDLLSNTLMNWAHLIDASAKNRAAKETLEAAERLGAARQAVPGEKKTVWYMDAGQKQEFKVDDPYLLTAINGLTYAGLRGPMMDILSKTKHWLTMGVTASPFFKVRNLIRDSVQAIATSDLGYNPISNVVEGAKLTNRQRQEYVSALAGGGLIRFGTMLEGNEAARARQLIKIGASDEHILDNESKVRQMYDKYLEPFFTAYNELGNRGEEINRMSLYDQLIKQGKSHAEASLLARDLMDFSMQGSWETIRFLTQVVPFMNARLQGLYKLGRAAKEDPAKMAVVLGGVTLASLALLAMYGDDDDWKKREDWDRDNYWWLKIGGTAFRIPKPFEIGAIATLAERSAELMFDNEMTGERFRKVTSKVVLDQLSMNPVPQLVKPIIDLYANKDSFTGRPIETMGMEKLDPSYRFRQNTSMVARGISSAGNALTGENFLSPVQVDHLVRGYFSWLGSFVVGGADMAVRSVSDQPTRPALDYWKTATGGMVSELDGASSRYVSQMYDQAKELEQAYGTYHQLLKDGKPQDAAEYREDNREKLDKYRSVENVKRAESKLNERIRMIERSNMGSDEKRDLINTIRTQQDRLARQLVPAA